MSEKRRILVDEEREIPVIGRCRYTSVTHYPTTTISKRLDQDRDDGRIAPDLCFLLKRIILYEGADKEDNARRAVLEILRNREPLSQTMRDRVAIELEKAWWPKVGRPSNAAPETVRDTADWIEAVYRKQGVDRPRSTALEETARVFGYKSVEAVRKAMQPSRRRQPRG